MREIKAVIKDKGKRIKVKGEKGEEGRVKEKGLRIKDKEGKGRERRKNGVQRDTIHERRGKAEE